jgi:LDH2 family malate/lactate/ureidoglycolate dehydrogenase
MVRPRKACSINVVSKERVVTEAQPVHAYAAHRAQIEAILRAWGMKDADADVTADILSWADLHGIDSHGMSMMPTYDSWRRDGRVRFDRPPEIVRQTPVAAVIDAGGNLGHPPARFAMADAIERARNTGLAAVAVRNSSHFGACGYYTLMAAEAGMIGMAATSASGVRVAPTGGAMPRLGTDPWSFAAPGTPGRPFLLDMATTTVAYGRVRNKANEGAACPPGWVLTPDLKPTTDPLDVVERPGFLTSLGGPTETGGHKGYGLAVMVNILSACLIGATVPTDPDHGKKADSLDLGHFFLVIDPGVFRYRDAVIEDIARFCDALRATPPADPAVPVQVAGDKERATAAARMRDGIPVGAGLLGRVRSLTEACGAPWLL